MKFFALCKAQKMANSHTRLLLNESSKESFPCLKAYLEEDQKRAKSFLQGEEADQDCATFAEGINNLTSILEDFIPSKDKSLSVLALGKIQSGKTAHMLGTIAWAVDTRIAFATILTGVTSDLNNQTVNRLNKTLGSIGKDYVRVFLVPTSHTGKEYSELKSSIEEIIFQRISRDSDGEVLPLPVLASLKTVQRINTLNYLHEELSEKYGSDLISLILDDEADQASQNSGASKGKTTKIYDAISNVRKSLVRNIYLAYTATPQAVLLTERFGKLRPDLTVVVPPRKGYFGLEDLVSKAFEQNLIEVSDWSGTSETITQIPESLKNSLHDYLWLSAIKFLKPEVFYLESNLQGAALDEFMKSTQMMIHESSRVRLHTAMYRFVEDELKAYKEDLVAFCTDKMPSEARSSFTNSLSLSWSLLHERLSRDLQRYLPENPDSELINALLEVVSDTKIVIVNGDKSRITGDIKFPVDTQAWEAHKSWICIGGDILGRGLTIPHLITTYFIRASKIPNFDTVSQQMRFCGYRSGYRSFTTLWAEHSTFLSFRYMREIESVIWNRAKRWDEERLRINIDIPKVFYASPASTRMEPTRKSVRDPNLVDSQIKGELIFSARKIMAPTFFRNNFSLIRRWFVDHENNAEVFPEWILLKDFSNADVYSLLGQWASDDSEKHTLLGVMELFAADMAALGLSEVPRAMFISRDVLEYPALRDRRDLEELVGKTKFFRAVSNANETLSLADWSNEVLSGQSESLFNALGVTHIGGTIRKLKKQLEFDATVFIVQFIRGVQGKGPNSKNISLGLTMTIMAPSNYEVRIIGHP
jgi:hypothetical protein